MDLKHEELQQAILISRAIQDYFRINYDKKEVRSTDLYEYLTRCDLIERDRQGGNLFREFLKRLMQQGFLSLIPQCIYTTSSTGHYEWRFIRMTDEKLDRLRNKHSEKRASLLHLPKMKEEEMDSLLEADRTAIRRLKKRDTSEFTPQQHEIRKQYPRAYEYWSEKEIAIMYKAFSSIGNVEKIAKLLQRQPHVVKTKLQEMGMQVR